ncbi:MAG: hypothetical protein RB294_08080 [Bacteroidales bacterium]|nr:hypothetical protein [Bacteroidales bacterium]
MKYEIRNTKSFSAVNIEQSAVSWFMRHGVYPAGSGAHVRIRNYGNDVEMWKCDASHMWRFAHVGIFDSGKDL